MTLFNDNIVYLLQEYNRFKVNTELAERDFVYWFKKDVLQLSPFFRTTKNPKLKFNVYVGSPRSRRSGLGTDLV